MGELRVMSRRGDDRVAWDTRQAETGDPEALAAVKEAARIFHEQQGAGATAFRVQYGRALIQIEAFDPAAEQIVVIPPQVGG
ncbi:MAG TPA: hypothetical protein VJR48_05525 [Ktedonobacterales bacterium]|nr:hypothetical protein [Ktedonobacterales bacterium]